MKMTVRNCLSRRRPRIYTKIESGNQPVFLGQLLFPNAGQLPDGVHLHLCGLEQIRKVALGTNEGVPGGHGIAVQNGERAVVFQNPFLFKERNSGWLFLSAISHSLRGTYEFAQIQFTSRSWFSSIAA